ncbi:MAG: hypothetical protein IJY54_01935 [Paludibacteraceae bacterium]|nr:hypothetical protein [Paludibacteraceae bacterium]
MSPQVVNTMLAIIDTFTMIRHLACTMESLQLRFKIQISWKLIPNHSDNLKLETSVSTMNRRIWNTQESVC